MARVSDHFGRALGSGLTGMLPVPYIRIGADHDQAHTVADGQDQAWRHSRLLQDAGPTTVFASPTSATSSEPFPSFPHEFEQIPDLAPDPVLDQFIDVNAYQAPQYFIPTPSLSRAPSQKRQFETVGDSPPSLASFQIPERKRQKRVTNGYRCTACPKIFDLKCEATKHYKQAHELPDRQCTHCNKKFHWPKDVKRHLKQVHHIWIEKVELLEAENNENIPPDDAVEDGLDMKVEAAEETPEQDAGATGPRPRPRRQSTKMSISRVVMMMKALNLMSSKDGNEDEEPDEEKKFFITQDSHNWRTISLSGVQTTDQLRQKIINTLPVPAENFILHQYHSQGKGKRIPMRDLMSAATRAFAGKRTLEVVLTKVAVAPAHT